MHGAFHSTNATGGAGAGGLRTNMPTCPYAQAPYPVGTGSYTVVVGGGGGYARENPSLPSCTAVRICRVVIQNFIQHQVDLVVELLHLVEEQVNQENSLLVQCSTGGSGGGGDTYSPSHPHLYWNHSSIT